MDPDRVRSYLKTACSTLNFDVGEIWCSRAKNMIGGRKDELRFIQLHMTSTYEKIRSKLLQPTRIPDKQELERHSFSPVICDHVRNGGQLVWANTETMSGVLGRSDLPLRTAVGMPICCVGYDLCILVLFSPKYLEATHDRREFLYALAAASSDTLSGFLPASISSPIRSVVAESNPFGTVILPTSAPRRSFSSFRDAEPRRRGAGGSVGVGAASAEQASQRKDSASPDSDPLTRVTRLQRGIIVQMWALHDIPRLRDAMPDSAANLGLDGSGHGGGHGGGHGSSGGGGGPGGLYRKSPGRSRSNSLGLPQGGGASGRASPAVAFPDDMSREAMPEGGAQSGNLDDLIWNSIIEDFDLEGEQLLESDKALPMGLGLSMGLASAPGSQATSTTSSVAELGRASPHVLDSLFQPPSRPPSAPLSSSSFHDSETLGFGADDLQDIASLLNAASSDNAAVATAARERLVASGTPPSGQRQMTPPLPTQIDADELDARIKRFEEFVIGFMGMSVFHAADLWVMVRGDAKKKSGETSSANEDESADEKPQAHVSGATITTVDEERARRAVLKRSKTREVTPQGGISNVSVIDDEPGVLRLACSHVADAALQAWPTYTSSFRFEPGQGFPGQILQKGSPQWESDFGKLSPLEYPRAAAAKELGLHTAFGVPLPLVYDPELRRARSGALVFYSMSVVQARPLMLGFVERAAALLWGAPSGSTDCLSLYQMTAPGERDPAVKSPHWQGGVRGRSRSRTPPLRTNSPGLEDAKDLLQLRTQGRRSPAPVTVPVPRAQKPSFVTEENHGAGGSGFTLNGLDVRWDPQKRQWVTEDRASVAEGRRSYSPAYSPGLDLLSNRIDSVSPGFSMDDDPTGAGMARGPLAFMPPPPPPRVPTPTFDSFAEMAEGRDAARQPGYGAHAGSGGKPPAGRGTGHTGFYGVHHPQGAPGFAMPGSVPGTMPGNSMSGGGLPGSMLGAIPGSMPGTMPGNGMGGNNMAGNNMGVNSMLGSHMPGSGVSGSHHAGNQIPGSGMSGNGMLGMPGAPGSGMPGSGVPGSGMPTASMLGNAMQRSGMPANAMHPGFLPGQTMNSGMAGANPGMWMPTMDMQLQGPFGFVGIGAGAPGPAAPKMMMGGMAGMNAAMHAHGGMGAMRPEMAQMMQRPGMGMAMGVTPASSAPVSTDQRDAGPVKDGPPSDPKVCRVAGCQTEVVRRTLYCSEHSSVRHCQYEGCNKCAQGSTKYCIRHGGGRRCTYPGCTKGARDKYFCAAHGGGKRCTMEGCTKAAVGGSNLCTAHGGGRRCQYEGCRKSAQSSTNYCVRHGGGRKCQVASCEKVARGRTQFCAAHGGGIRCRVEGCKKAAVGQFQLCRVHAGTAQPKKRPAAEVLTAAELARLTESARQRFN